jgi:hypothetical protein
MSDESGNRAAPPPVTCWQCGKEMGLVWLIPKSAKFPELRKFRCAACGRVHAVEIEEEAPSDIRAKILRFPDSGC